MAGKILLTPTAVQNRMILPSIDDGFGRALMHLRENIGTQEEKESGSVEIKLKRHLVLELRHIKGFGDTYFRTIAIVVWKFKDIQRLSCRVRSRELSITTAGCIRS